MNDRKCARFQACFSAYIDGAISGHKMLELSRHIEGEENAAGDRIGGCDECGRELAAWKLAQNSVAALGSAKAPGDLALKLRIAISREKARRESRWVDRLSLAWDNSIRPRLVQVSAGLAGSIALGSMVLLLGVVAAPQSVLANDEPLGALTAPHLRYSTYSPSDIITARDTPIVVQASVDAAGRVYDFTIVSGPHDEAVKREVAEQLFTSIYEPASAFGVPVRGQVVVTYAGISVHG